jgi:membrane-associated phospholipid phosphatase
VKHSLILLSIILFAFAPKVYGSSPADTGSVSYKAFNQQIRSDSILSFRSAKGFVPALLHDFGVQATAPFHATKKQCLMILGGTAITLALIHYDQQIENKFRPVKAGNKWIGEVSPQVTELGDYYGFEFLVGFGALSYAAREHRMLHTSMLAAQSAITAGVWARFFKILFGRMRPGATYKDQQYPEGHWFGPTGQFNASIRDGRGVAAFDAFPSGHTAAAFSMATAFAMQYQDKPAVPVIAYSIAGIVGVTRIIEHEHWASDVFAGAVLGYVCGRQVVQHYRQLFPDYVVRKPKKARSSVYITAPKNGIGIGYSWVW